MAAAKSLEKASLALNKVRTEMQNLVEENRGSKFLEEPILEAEKLLKSSKTLGETCYTINVLISSGVNVQNVTDTLKKVANGVPTGEGGAL